MQRIVITVDGLAGSGKTTISRLLAQKLGFIHLNTGLLYRAIGYLVLKNQINPDDEKAIDNLLKSQHISLALGEQNQPEISISDVLLKENLQRPEISEITSVLAAKPKIRESLILSQREAFLKENLVAEGRDMGTVIFPDAQVKFFVIATPQVRANRRIEQLYGDISAWNQDRLATAKQEMESEIVERDRRDTERSLSPTKPATSSITIDNSSETLTTIVEKMYAHCLNMSQKGS